MTNGIDSTPHTAKFQHAGSSRPYLFATLAALLLAPASCRVAAQESSSICPFLASINVKTNAETFSGDLLQLVIDLDDKHRDLQKRRYDHYNSGSASQYKNYRNKKQIVYSNLADIWLCLACAVGWTVWLVSATRSQTTNSGIGSTLFDEKESKQVIGNVLQVTLGEDPDGTGIPVYHTLVDYVVENQDLASDAPLQVRKCFTTGFLLEEGFANVKVLVLLEDPTTSILMADYIKDRNARNQQELEPPDMMYSMMVYLIAAILIITSLIGGLHAYFKLSPDQMMWGKLTLALGTILVYPVALFLYVVLGAGYRWITPLIERPGVIINGAQNCWDHRCGANLDPMDLMGSFDGSFGPSSSPTSGGNARIKSRRKRRAKSNLPDVMEMSSVATSNSIESKNQQEQQNANKGRSLYPNAGCGYGDFNVLLPKGRGEKLKEAYGLGSESMSSISSGEYGQQGIARRKTEKSTLDDEALPTLPLSGMDESEYDIAGGEPLRMRPLHLDQGYFATHLPTAAAGPSGVSLGVLTPEVSHTNHEEEDNGGERILQVKTQRQPAEGGGGIDS
jgi:hypothetical protein